KTAVRLADYAAHQARHGFAFWAVIERGTGRLIGDAGLEVTAHGVELGYTLARHRWGHGFATEAGRLCLEAADGPLGLRRLVGIADVENPASARVLARLGFEDDGPIDAYGRPHRRFVRERGGVALDRIRRRGAALNPAAPRPPRECQILNQISVEDGSEPTNRASRGEPAGGDRRVSGSPHVGVMGD